jgi:DNA-binding PadR family transcriptional regulator
LAEIPEGFHLILRELVKRGLVEKGVEEVETKREVYGKRLVCTITERGAKARKALKAIQAL